MGDALPAELVKDYTKIYALKYAAALLFSLYCCFGRERRQMLSVHVDPVAKLWMSLRREDRVPPGRGIAALG